MFEMARKRSRAANSNVGIVRDDSPQDFLFRQPKEESKEGKHKTVAEKREEKRNLKSKISWVWGRRLMDRGERCDGQVPRKGTDDHNAVVHANEGGSGSKG